MATYNITGEVGVLSHGGIRGDVRADVRKRKESKKPGVLLAQLNFYKYMYWM